MFSAIDCVRIGNDRTPGRLPKNLGKADRWDHFAANDAGEHAARSDRGQLIRISDENEPAIRRKRTQQRAHQRNIDHGAFIYDHGVARERVILILLKNGFPSVFGNAGAEQPMHGLRVLPREF